MTKDEQASKPKSKAEEKESTRDKTQEGKSKIGVKLDQQQASISDSENELKQNSLQGSVNELTTCSTYTQQADEDETGETEKVPEEEQRSATVAQQQVDDPAPEVSESSRLSDREDLAEMTAEAENESRTNEGSVTIDHSAESQEQQTDWQRQQQRQQQQHRQHHHHSKRNQRRAQVSAAVAAAGIATIDQQQVPMSADYLAQLIKDKKQLASFPSVFMHVQRLLDEEINKVRQSLFQLNDVVKSSEPLELPEPEGELVQLQEKIYVPVGEHPEYNFVGRLLGPRGMTAKQLEQETGCKIMIRGRGSMRDKKKEEQNRGKANWEHLNDELHVLITVEDSENRAQVKLARAIEEVRQLLVPIVDGEDELKKRQLMELAIINGTYRDCNYNEALTKMLNEAVYRQTLGADLPVNSSQHLPIKCNNNHLASRDQLALVASSQSPVNSTLSQHQQRQNYNTPTPTMMNPHPYHHQQLQQQQAQHPTINGSSVSSGVASSGSDTPNSSTHSQQQSAAAAAAAVAALAAAAAAGNPHGLVGPGASSAAAVAAAAAAAAAAQHAPAHHHHHPIPAPAGAHAMAHAASQSSAVAAAAAAAQLMGAGPADLMYHAQQYHDFHHYAAAMAAAAAQQQQQQHQQPLLGAPDYTVHHQPSVAQVVAQANHQLHHYQQQLDSSNSDRHHPHPHPHQHQQHSTHPHQPAPQQAQTHQQSQQQQQQQRVAAAAAAIAYHHQQQQQQHQHHLNHQIHQQQQHQQQRHLQQQHQQQAHPQEDHQVPISQDSHDNGNANSDLEIQQPQVVAQYPQQQQQQQPQQQQQQHQCLQSSQADLCS